MAARLRRKKDRTTKEKIIDSLWVLCQMAGLGFFAWLNASHFDATELKMLGEFAVYYKLLETLRGYTT